MNNRLLKKYSLFLFFVCGTVSGVFAQRDDITTWTSMGVKHELFKDFTLGGRVELRTKNSLKEIDRWGIRLNGGYRINSYLSTEAGYELHHRNRGDEGWKFRHRYFLGTTASISWDKFKFSLRERFQQSFFEGEAENRLRSLLKVGYSPSGSILSPYFSMELYQALGGAAFWDVARMRYRPGIEIKLSEKWTLDLFYCYQYEPDKKKHIIGLEGSFTF